MNRRAVWAIIRKDLKVVSQSKGVLLPLIIVPIFIFVLLPAITGVGASAELPFSALSGMDSFVSNLPSGLKAELSGYDERQRLIVLTLLYFMAPMYLIVPLMVASVIAADSFAGEKERKTLEALIYTPTTDRDLFVAKLGSAWLTAVAIGLAGFVLYGLVANLAAWPIMGRVFFPNLAWIALAFWVGPAVAGMGLGITVLVSARVRTFQEAYQMGGVVVLPILLLIIGQASGVIYFNLWLVLLLGLFLWAVDVAILWFGGKTFRRTELISKL